MKFNLKYWSGGFILLASFLSHAAVFNGQVEGFNLYTCGPEICFKITSQTAYIGKIDGNYAFDQATLEFLNKKTNISEKFESDDVYYDHQSNYIYIRNVGIKKSSYVFNINDQKLSRF